MGPLVVNVADLLHRPGTHRDEHLRARLEGLRVVDTTVPAEGDVVVDVRLESVHDGVLATGAVGAPWTGECRRCLRPVAGQVESRFQELFEPRPTEGETWPLRQERTDLEPLVREAVLVELPLAPLCREDCRGLCPSCGADLNQGQCACVRVERDPRWAALDALRTDLDS